MNIVALHALEPSGTAITFFTLVILRSLILPKLSTQPSGTLLKYTGDTVPSPPPSISLCFLANTKVPTFLDMLFRASFYSAVFFAYVFFGKNSPKAFNVILFYGYQYLVSSIYIACSACS